MGCSVNTPTLEQIDIEDKPTVEGLKRWPPNGYYNDDACICKETCLNPCMGFSWMNKSDDGCKCYA